MDETPSFWNKKPDDLTVGENLKFVALVPAAMLIGFVAPAAVLSGVEKIRNKFRKKQPELALVETTATEE